VPSFVENREFAFLLFGEQMMLRHKSLKSQSELASFFQDMTPSDVYYSIAYYADPSLSMESKGWLGADLVFDIDADHLLTPCNKVHDMWVCMHCGFYGKGITPETCPICGKQKFEVKSWPCEVCLKSAKEELIKLLDFLLEDFGFSKSEIRLFFSGHRGYHVHVESGDVKMLGSLERKEIVDYIIGRGLDVVLFGHGMQKKQFSKFWGAVNLDIGWNKRLFEGVSDIIISAKGEDLGNIGLGRDIIDKFMRNRDIILESWKKFGRITAVKGIGYETFRKIIDFCIKKQSATLDTVVTTDVHRLIRLEDTLHGKTGFKKVEFSFSETDSFDPCKSAIAFKKGSATVSVSSAPEFKLGEDVFGPYENQNVELPAAAAVLLVLKGRAEIVKYAL